jgi:hypothetical protein
MSRQADARRPQNVIRLSNGGPSRLDPTHFHALRARVGAAAPTRKLDSAQLHPSGLESAHTCMDIGGGCADLRPLRRQVPGLHAGVGVPSGDQN